MKRILLPVLMLAAFAYNVTSTKAPENKLQNFALTYLRHQPLKNNTVVTDCATEQNLLLSY